MEEERVVRLTKQRLTLGRNATNDVVLDDVNVSRFHAEIVVSGDVVELRDLHSRCGTRLNGRPVKSAAIKDGGVVGIGPYSLRFDGSALTSKNQRGALSLSARDVSVKVGGKQILDSVSLDVAPGEMVAIIGASGAGKSTLLKGLAGVTRPTAGTITLSGDPVTARLTDVGYVPQDEIVHRGLTCVEALTYAAKLRLPDDTEAKLLASTVRRVISEMSLDGRENTRVGSLSGGERKRTGVASELVNRPSLLFLDEPTTGLDPQLETQAMALFRDLADPDERAVVLVTHATKNLGVCDKLAVMGDGGRLVYFGKPDEALAFFGVESFDDIYTALSESSSGDLRARFERGRRSQAEAAGIPDPPSPGPTGSPRAKLGFVRQTTVLTGRYMKLFARDQRNLAILLGQVPLIAFAIALLFEAGIFATAAGLSPGVRPGNPDQQIQLLFLLATTAIWFGSIDGSREIVKERSVWTRESAVGVSVDAYLLSKAIVLFGLAAVQTLSLMFFVLVIRPLDASLGAYAAVAAVLVLASWAALGIGLAVSAGVRTEDQATSFIPLTLIPQLLFAGAVVPVARMVEPIASISTVVPARWTLAGLGSAIDMNDRLGADRELARFAGYGTDFFGGSPAQACAVLLIFLLVSFLTAGVLTARTRG